MLYWKSHGDEEKYAAPGDMTPYRPLEVRRRSGGTYALKLQGRRYARQEASVTANEHTGIKEKLDKRNRKTEYVHGCSKEKKKNSVALVCERTIPIEQKLLVGEVGANFCGWRVSRGQRNGSPRPYSRFSRPAAQYQTKKKEPAAVADTM
jgi:hypothetical protein